MSVHTIFEQVESLISAFEVQRNQYVVHPQKDFSRHRKISFSDCLKSTIFMSGGSLFSELLDYFEQRSDIPSVPAYVQQRAKIKPEAFEQLLHQTTLIGTPKLYRGYRLFAADGSDVHIPTNAADPGTYFEGTAIQNPYNMLHLNAVYDLCGNLYQDVVIQDRRAWDEAGALTMMVDRSSIDKAILIADRGYESYNVMAHIQEKGWKYLIRIKDFTGNGIASRLDLPDADEFDLSIDLNITRKLSNEVKQLLQDRNHYRYAPPNSKLDFLPPHSKYDEAPVFYRMPFRVLRFPITENQYEMVVTNLNSDEFSSKEIKKMYAMRWGIETSFRSLKYHTGLLYFHSKRKNLVLQEIFARLILFNLTALLSGDISRVNTCQKHEYKVNCAHALRICKKLFLQRITTSYAESLLTKSVVPIRNAREFKRKESARIAPNFIYRIS